MVERCDFPGCNRKPTAMWGELADMFTCEGHRILMQSNGDSYSIPPEEVETHGPIFMAWATRRKEGIEWLRANPNPEVSETDNEGTTTT